MRVIKPFRSTVLHRPYRFKKKNYLGVTVGLLVDFKGGQHIALHEQELWKLFGEESIAKFGAETLDFGIPKSRPEVLLTAYAFGKYAIDGRTGVSLQVNNIKKDLWVTGTRYWVDGKSTTPQSFDSISISRYNTFGGVGFDNNPVGKGKSKIQVDGMLLKELPNVENPFNPVYNENDEYPDISYGPLPIEYPGRNSLMGTYDEKWKTEEFPGFASDIDWEYFNQAPKDQRLNKLSVGDKLTFTHMHPEHDVLTFSIPSIKPRVFLKLALPESMREINGYQHIVKSSDLNEVNLNLTTVWAFPHEEKSILLYQGSYIVTEDDGSDIELLAVSVEDEQRPKSIDYYADVITRRMDLKKGGLYSLLETELLDERFYTPNQFEQIEFTPILEKKLNQAQQKFDELREKLESKGINHEQVEEMLKMVDKSNLPDYALSMLSDMKKQDMLRALLDKKISYQEFVAYQIKEIEKMPSFLEMNRQNRKATRQIKAQYKNKLLDNKESTEQDLYTQKIAKNNVEFLQKHMNQKVPFNHINGIDEIGEKGIYFDKLEETIQQSRVNYLESINTTKSSGVDLFDVDDNSANKEIFEIVDFEQIDNLLLSINQRFLMSGVRIEEANLKHKKLSQGIFRECTFSNCDLSKAQFVGSKFEKVIFQGCNFTEANFEKAVFKECKFVNCTLIKLGANLSKFEIVEFIESKISAWNHFRIFFEKLIFEKCYCEDWILSRTFSSKILFRSCHIIRSGFVMGRLEELDLVGCIVESLSVVLVKKIGCLNFNSSTIEKLFIKDGTSIQNFQIDKCNIHYSGLRGIIVNKFYVLNSNLDRNDLSESELLYVSFENSTFKYSMMIRTVFYDFKFKLVDLSFSMMKASKFKQGILHKVSFFSTDLSLVDIDNNTIQERCLTERANLLPKYGDYYG